jgi:hypothetical protein
MNGAPMSTETKLKTLARGLLDKTKAGQVNWIQDREDDKSYKVILPQSRITLRYTVPRVEPDFITLAFYNADGVIVGALKAEEPEPDESNPDWELLNSLFTEVHRSAAGWDKVVTEIEKALASPGPIGTLPPAGGAGVIGAVGSVAGSGSSGTPPRPRPGSPIDSRE